MNVPKFGAHEARALPQMAWQVSAVPAQLLGLHGQRGAEGRGLPFLAAVTGTAVLGVVDWPVALLIAGGYLLSSRPPGQSPPAGSLPAPAPALHDAAAERRTPAAPPLADAKPAAAEPAPVLASAAEPGRAPRLPAPAGPLPPRGSWTSRRPCRSTRPARRWARRQQRLGRTSSQPRWPPGSRASRARPGTPAEHRARLPPHASPGRAMTR